MASTLIATKVEEEPKTLKQIIDEYAKIYARRLILANFPDVEKNFDDKNTLPTIEELVKSSAALACLQGPISHWTTGKQRRRICSARLPKELNKYGPVYKEWHEQITKMESILLRQFGFTFYWIPDSHPHKYILKFCEALDLKHKMVWSMRAVLYDILESNFCCPILTYLDFIDQLSR